MTITSRDELINEWAKDNVSYVVNLRGQVATLEKTLDWFSEQGLGLVPLKPTEDMAEAVKEANTSWMCDSTIDPRNALLELARRLHTAAIETGDLLKLREF